MKKLILSVAFSLFILSVTAQDKIDPQKKSPEMNTKQNINRFQLSIGLDEGIPVGELSKYSSFVMGASIQGEYAVLKELGLTLSANYLYFLGKNGRTGLSFVPVLAGAKFYLSRKIYISGQLGAAMYIGQDSEDDTYLSYAQGIGFQASNRIDLLAKYEGINIGGSRTYSFAGLRIAYNLFKRKK
ncbi:hypothetical protein [Pedobacter caeni]|uniref:Outer membrane protein beta-barrel domain-containing protein n=1 Tax=Pedobacter caeni TaxID=288992 RepID=A0A1M5H4G1_9SPHI|nr:hypothetical protein [Pedobacter caeni]SHG10773.1 hypothetical protein SAMN04488522_104500 [Pedobacter caeni]